MEAGTPTKGSGTDDEHSRAGHDGGRGGVPCPGRLRVGRRGPGRQPAHQRHAPGAVDHRADGDARDGDADDGDADDGDARRRRRPRRRRPRRRRPRRRRRRPRPGRRRPSTERRPRRPRRPTVWRRPRPRPKTTPARGGRGSSPRSQSPGGIAFLVMRRSRRATAWRQQVAAAFDETTRLATHLAAVVPEGATMVAAQDAGRLAGAGRDAGAAGGERRRTRCRSERSDPSTTRCRCCTGWWTASRRDRRPHRPPAGVSARAGHRAPRDGRPGSGRGPSGPTDPGGPRRRLTLPSGPLDEEVPVRGVRLCPPARQAGAMTTRLSGTGIWSGALRYGDKAEAAERAAELESARLHGAVGPRRGRRAVRLARQPARRDVDRHHRHRHPQRLDAHAGRDGRAARRLTAEHGPRFLCGLGHQPPAAHRRRQRARRLRRSRWPR